MPSLLAALAAGRRRSAVGEVESSEYALVSANLTWDGASQPRLIFRKLDSLNYVAAGPSSDGIIRVTEYVNGVGTVIGTSETRPPVGVPCTVTADIYVDWVTIRIDGTLPRGGEPMTFLSAHDFQARTATGTTGGHWGPVSVAPTDRPILNWPRFHHLGTRVFPDIGLGSAGEWDSVDCNNPNVLPNPDGGWLLSYTGYNGNAGLSQAMGIAHSATLDGPWIKDERNPLFADPYQWSMNGGIVHTGEQWLQSYGTGSLAMTVGIATSPDLVNWTVRPTVGPGWDTTARVATNGDIEVYYKRDTQIWRYRSTDGGTTWDAGNIYMIAPAWFSTNGASFAEPAIYVPPGKDGQQAILTVDQTVSIGRRTMMAITVDGGASWQWALLHGGGAIGSGDRSRFDSFLAHDGAGGFYLYYCGSDSTTGTLNGALKIGHRRIDWNSATLVRA